MAAWLDRMASFRSRLSLASPPRGARRGSWERTQAIHAVSTKRRTHGCTRCVHATIVEQAPGGCLLDGTRNGWDLGHRAIRGSADHQDSDHDAGAAHAPQATVAGGR